MHTTTKYILIILLAIAGCISPGIDGHVDDETDSGVEDSETGLGVTLGTDDDSGTDLDLPDEFDAPCDAPLVSCAQAECWAYDSGWTAQPSAVTSEMIATLESLIWEPSDLPVGDRCWTLTGTDRHACLVDLCGAPLLGQPATELPLEPSDDCDFLGPWESTAWAFDTCFGLLDGVAIELRAL